jgi:hypothetical protein
MQGLVVLLAIVLLGLHLVLCDNKPPPPPKYKPPPVVCHDPAIGEHSKHAKYVITGHAHSGGGIGNSIVFFPNAFIFAALTGRDILIGDHSALTELCTVLTCGYPRVSTIAKSLPENQARTFPIAKAIKVYDMGEYFRGDMLIDSDHVHVDGYLPHLTPWYLYLNNNTKAAVDCLAKITGCARGNDISCVSRYALQSWIRGPFVSSFTDVEMQRIKGIPPYVMNGLLTLPHSYAPRMDVGIHLRIQFSSFEQGLSASSTAYKKEVRDWLEAPLADHIFKVFETELLQKLDEAKDPAVVSQDYVGNEVRDLEKDPYLVYVAADNQEVKEAFVDYLKSEKSPVSKVKNLFLMFTDAKEIVHIKNINNVKTLTAGEGILDLAFDWYALSLSNVILNYRTGGKLLSTFVHSAAWTSGNMLETNKSAPIGKGMGCKAYTYDNKANKWEMFWVY